MARRGERGIPRAPAWTASEDRAVAERLEAAHPDWGNLARELGRSADAVASRAGKLRADRRALNGQNSRPCACCGKKFSRPNRQGRWMLCVDCYYGAGGDPAGL